MAKKCKPGFKRRGNKCIKVGSSKRSRKKGFNPFKMWGSYVGLVVAFIVSFVMGAFGAGLTSGSYSFTIFLAGYSPIEIGRDCSSAILSCLNVSAFIAWGFLIAGFLIGWGIHSLFRFLKQRK